MIKQLQITNFESHNDTDIQFSPGVNCIIGSTDSGKSALIRALQWILTNRPLGDSFRSHWGGDTVVSIDLNDLSVSREKGKNNNYRISNIDKPLDAPGKEVPEPVLKVLNMEEINSQYQLDRPFLLLNTPGEVAKYLNKIVNWDNIDRAQSRIKSKKLDINKDIKSKTYDLEKKEERLKEFDYLKDFESDLRDLEKKYKEYKDIKEQYTFLYKIIQEIENINQQIEDNKKNYPSQKQIDSFVEKVKQLEDLNIKYGKMNTYLLNIKSLKDSLSFIKEKSSKLKIKYNKLSPETCPLCGQKILKKRKNYRTK